MSTADGKVIGTTQIVDNGPAYYRFNIVILSEGYRASELGQFATDAQDFATTLSRTAPYYLVMNAINIFRVDVSSTDSGAADPAACGGTGASPKTYFDATFCSGGALHRLLAVNDATAFQVAGDQVPQYNLVVVIVNSTIYGGSGGAVATFSLAPGADEIGLHEMGHTVFAFADEYGTLQGCSSGETGHDHHPAVEPAAVNATVTGANDADVLKWGQFVFPPTSLPTTTNADCTQCDPQASPVPTGTVGAFEGADYFHCGAWRPEFDCRMRTLGQPFCRVCQAKILSTLVPYSPLDPVFAWKGVGADPKIYFGWGGDRDQYELNDRGTSDGPALAVYQGIFMAWKGQGGDQRLWFSRQTTPDRVTWSPQAQVPGVGTSTGPALALFQGKVRMAWKGIVGDQGIYTNTYDSAIGWSPQAGIPGVGTSTRPALAVFNGRLFMAWKGIAGDQSIYFTSFDGTTWAPQAPIPGVGTDAYPTLAVLGNRLFMAWKGIAGDPGVYFASSDGSTWSPQAPVPNIGTTTGLSLAAGPDRLFLAWGGVAPDESLYYTAFDGTFWGPQHNYLDTGSSAVPALVVDF